MRPPLLPAESPFWLLPFARKLIDGLSDIWNTPLRLKDYATADLPPAADWTQGLAYDVTVPAVKYSDGTTWQRLMIHNGGAALTRVDDTNVTLTLGGTPATALLQATSLTLGWSGTLAVARGGTGGGSASGTLLDNITGFSSTGILVRTAAGAYAFRTITGTANKITVTNGDGVAANPTLTIPDAVTLVTPTVTGTLTAQALVDISGASAGQIQFPATQNSSSNANTLDDYEEGSFTPNIEFGGATTGITYTAQTGRYTKIGRVVVVEIRIVLSAKGSATGDARIAGLPFTSTSFPTVGGAPYATAMSGLTVPMFSVAAADTDVLLFNFTGASVANMTDANFTDTSQLRLGFTYTAG